MKKVKELIVRSRDGVVLKYKDAYICENDRHLEVIDPEGDRGYRSYFPWCNIIGFTFYEK